MEGGNSGGEDGLWTSVSGEGVGDGGLESFVCARTGAASLRRARMCAAGSEDGLWTAGCVVGGS